MDTPTVRSGLRQAVLGAQMLLVAFGALVLVPILTGFDPNVALFTAGLGTLIFQAVTKRTVPVFLASSFAFIAPMTYGVQQWGMSATLSGLAAAGLLYIALSVLVGRYGSRVLDRVFPPIVVGPVIMVIGLVLAPVAVNMASGRTGDGSTEVIPFTVAIAVAGLALGTTLLVALLGRGMTRLVPILAGMAAGYAVCLPLGLVDVVPLREAPWLAIPPFVLPSFNLSAILYVVPIAIAPAIEHVGDILAIGSITGRDYLEHPGLHRTLLGDGLATTAAAALGGPPNTTYSEVSGAVAITRAFDPRVMTWAAGSAVVLAFVGKLGALLQTIPLPVMGGILTLLFGAITVVGLNTLVKAGKDLTEPRNIAIVALILILGIGGLEISAGNFALQGIGLSAVVGVILNLVLPKGP